MTHPATKTLQRYALGELDAETRLELEEHFAECEDCARSARAERRLDEWIVQTAPGALPHGATRATFDRLWAEVDAQDVDGAPLSETERAGRPWWLRHLPRAAAAAALLLVVLTLWQAFVQDEPEVPAGHDVVATEDGTPSVPDTQPAAQDLAVVDVRLTTEAEDLDLQRLAEARAAVADTLLRVSAEALDDDAAFLDATRAEFVAWEGGGWSIAHLVRGHALGGDDALRAAALRYAVLDPDSSGTLATALERPDLMQPVLDLLARHPVPLDDAPRLARALAHVIGRRHDQPLTAPGQLAADVLARDGGGAQLAELLQDTVARAATRPAQDPAVVRAYELLARVDVDAAVDALLQLGEEPAHEARARGEFLALADRELPGVTNVMVRSAERSRRPSVLVDWTLAARLHAVAEPLAAALQAGSTDDSLIALVAELGGARCVEPLFQAWDAQGDRPAAAPLRAALGSILNRDMAARTALGAGVGDDAVHALVRLADELPADIAGEVLVTCLQERPRLHGTDKLQAFLISSIARLGTERDGRALLAWIEAKDRVGGGNGSMPLAWAAATLLTQEASLAAWERAGHDPRVLADVSAEAGPWPAAAERPPTRLLRSLDRSLKRPSSRADRPRSSSSPDDDSPNDLSRKETR